MRYLRNPLSNVIRHAWMGFISYEITVTDVTSYIQGSRSTISAAPYWIRLSDAGSGKAFILKIHKGV